MEGAVVVVSNGGLRGRELVLELYGEARTSWVNKVSDKIYENVEVRPRLEEEGKWSCERFSPTLTTASSSSRPSTPSPTGGRTSPSSTTYRLPCPPASRVPPITSTTLPFPQSVSSVPGEYGQIRYTARALLRTPQTGEVVSSERVFNVSSG